MTDEKIKAEISTLVYIQGVMKQEGVPSVNKVFFAAQEIADFREKYGDPQLVLTRAIMDKTLEPAYKMIVEKSGGNIAKINNPEFQNQAENTTILGKGDAPAKAGTLAEKITKLNSTLARMPLNKSAGPTLFGIGEIDKPDTIIPSPESFSHYSAVMMSHTINQHGQSCATDCKTVDPAKMQKVNSVGGKSQ